MKLTPILSAVEKAAQDGLREAGRAVLARSNELAPELTGETAGSAFVAVDDLTVQVGYRSLVARLQHEILDYEHPRGGQAKFLELAADEVDIGAVVASKVQGELG